MTKPSLDLWLAEARQSPDAHKVGMYLSHNGVVRATARAAVRDGLDLPEVTGMVFSWDKKAVEEAVKAAEAMEGIFFVRVWLNEGTLAVGDDIMQVLIGGDIRPRTVAALETLVGRLKETCVTETELAE